MKPAKEQSDCPPEDKSGGKWSKHETSTVQEKLKEYIDNLETPPLQECKFLVTRTAKQVQDKVRNTIRKMQRNMSD